MGIAEALDNINNDRKNGQSVAPRSRGSSRSAGTPGTGNAVTNLFFELVLEKKNELEERIKSGESEPRYPIGAASYTESEWKKLIKSVDAIQEEIRKEAEREREQQEEKQQKKELQEAERTIIVYDIDGIRCVEAKTGICKWFIQY